MAEKTWDFNFNLAAAESDQLPAKKAEQLMDAIIAWAEENGCVVGGGYREAKIDDQ